MNPRELQCLSAGLCLGAFIMFIASTIDRRRQEKAPLYGPLNGIRSYEAEIARRAARQ